MPPVGGTRNWNRGPGALSSSAAASEKLGLESSQGTPVETGDTGLDARSATSPRKVVSSPTFHGIDKD